MLGVCGRIIAVTNRNVDDFGVRGYHFCEVHVGAQSWRRTTKPMQECQPCWSTCRDELMASLHRCLHLIYFLLITESML